MVNCLGPGLLIPQYSAALETEISWIFFFNDQLSLNTGLPGIPTFETMTAIPRITFAVSNRDFQAALEKRARMASRYKTRRVMRMPRHPHSDLSARAKMKEETKNGNSMYSR